MKHFLPLPLLLCLLCLTSCSDEEPQPQGPLPVITWDEPSGRYRIPTDEALTLVPNLENTDETTRTVWKRDGSVVSTLDSYTFVSQTAGTFYVQLLVTNRYGSTEDEIKITVEQREEAEIPEVPVNDSTFSWRFPWTEINIAQERTIRLRPYDVENAGQATYQWTVDNTVAGTDSSYLFTASTPGRHEVVVTITNDTLRRSQRLVVNVCPPAGTYRRALQGEAMVNRVYEYMPAPGHMVNGYRLVGRMFPDDCTHRQACDTVMEHFRRSWMISLGAQGGYLVAGFDHSVPESGGGELIVRGNPYDYQSEPGIIWVSQDDNGDGLPNDQWFELAGSEYGTSNEELEYCITYYRPQHTRSATAWRDHHGQTDYVPYMSYWNPSDTYWQPWVEGTEHSYFGSRLESHHTFDGQFSSIPPYGWGYADNQGSDYTDAGHYNISNARTWDGQPANLEYIDFVKIQTAQNGWTPNLGDISTEVYGIWCK